jgi:hypothetical protein
MFKTELVNFWFRIIKRFKYRSPPPASVGYTAILLDDAEIVRINEVPSVGAIIPEIKLV